MQETVSMPGWDKFTTAKKKRNYSHHGRGYNNIRIPLKLNLIVKVRHAYTVTVDVHLMGLEIILMIEIFRIERGIKHFQTNLMRYLGTVHSIVNGEICPKYRGELLAISLRFIKNYVLIFSDSFSLTGE